MNLENLGYTKELELYRKENNLLSFDIGRVITEYKDRYTVKTCNNEYDSELIGNLRFTATNKNALPAVGDWVTITEYDNNKALIHNVLPRKTILERKAVGKIGETQIIATNIDYGIIIQSVNRDFNINRLERYLTICNASKIKPLIVLSKIDLIDSLALDKLITDTKERIKNVALFTISNQSQIGIDKLKSELIKGKTYCLLGSSGVGKSTLTNILTGNQLMNTGEISKGINRGKHITSHRELIVLENGILIDNPGMREVGITDIADGLEMTFEAILNLSKNCKYSDCTHTNENECAILNAIHHKELDAASYANFIKMEKEKMYFESDAKDRKKKDKDLGKLIKNVKKQRKNNKY